MTGAGARAAETEVVVLETAVQAGREGLAVAVDKGAAEASSATTAQDAMATAEKRGARCRAVVQDGC